jgi:hypothetical protein
MPALEIMRCIRDARHHVAVAEAIRTCESARLVEWYELSEREQKAITDCDVRWLTDRGVHPFSLVQLSRVLDVDLCIAWGKDGS